ncbi:MAG: hypothetical protein K2W96_22820 [Gemmataceae bacterium]|nr:hypothetical protein [Gemmataceae bacterium]
MSNPMKHLANALSGVGVAVLVIALMAIPTQTAWADDPPPCPCMQYESAQECQQRLGMTQQQFQQYAVQCQFLGGNPWSCFWTSCERSLPPCSGYVCYNGVIRVEDCPCFIGTFISRCFCK